MPYDSRVIYVTEVAVVATNKPPLNATAAINDCAAYLRMKFLQTKILSARISQCRNEINDVLFVFEAGVIHDAISDLPLE